MARGFFLIGALTLPSLVHQTDRAFAAAVAAEAGFADALADR